MEEKVKKIFLKNLLNNECVHEEVEQFDQSIYGDIYEDGFILVQKIIEDTRRKNLYKNIGSKETEIKNVISFIGRRGTGKTSAMVSFYEALLKKDNTDYMEEKKQIQRKLGEDVVFVGIDYIDASRLEDSEDIFILVLAGMLNKLIEFNQKGEIEEWENRTLYQKFEKIFNDFSVLKQRKECWEDFYSGFEKLRNIASSQKIREQFSELVEKYLEIIVRKKKSFQLSFLVVMIDDIDMKKKEQDRWKKSIAAYDILQSIYQYLSVPKVIILTAYNHEYLYQQCIDYFYGNVRERCCGEKENDFVIKNNTNERMASEYMQKVLPIETRLYMPSWRKRDYGNERFIDISDQDKYLKNFVQAESTVLNVKKFILNLLAERTGIYYDCEGKKKHFFEPDTIRSLCSKTLILICLKEFEFPPRNNLDIEIYKRNLKRVKDDLFFRYVEERLVKANEKLLFDSWLSQSIERRGETIVNEIARHSKFTPLGKKYKQGYKIGESFSSYSYSELVHSIYHMTRDDNTYSKELVACVLSSFTLYLSEIYWEYQYEKHKVETYYYDKYIIGNSEITYDKEEVRESFSLIEDYYKILFNVIGGTICGHWADYYFPEVELERQSSNKIKTKLIDRYVVSYIEEAKSGYTLILNLKKKIREEEKKKIKGKIKLQIYGLIFACMLQKDFLFMSEKDIDEPEIETESSGQKTLNVEILFHGDLEFTAFFKHTFAYVAFFDKMNKIFFSRWEDKLKMGNFFDYRNIIREIVMEIRKEYWKWDQKYGTAMIPFYNLDISYNLIKHIFKECEMEQLDSFFFSIDDENKNENNQSFIEILEKNEIKNNKKTISTFLKEYKKMLERFLEHLKSIDEFYKIPREKGFQETFLNCPFFEMIEELFSCVGTKGDDTFLNELFNFLDSTFKDLKGNKSIEKDPEQK